VSSRTKLIKFSLFLLSEVGIPTLQLYVTMVDTIASGVAILHGLGVFQHVQGEKQDLVTIDNTN